MIVFNYSKRFMKNIIYYYNEFKGKIRLYQIKLRKKNKNIIYLSAFIYFISIIFAIKRICKKQLYFSEIF